jgi:hypothetical protein
MPIKARIDRLSTGIPTPIGIQVFGKYLGGMERLAKQIEAVVPRYFRQRHFGFTLRDYPDQLEVSL